MKITDFDEIQAIVNNNAKEVEILYLKDVDENIDIKMGICFFLKKNPKSSLKEIMSRYVSIGKFRTALSADSLFSVFQGENYSPKGEAKNFITQKGLHHTSMSIGDIVKMGSKILVCSTIGFIDLRKELKKITNDQQ